MSFAARLLWALLLLAGYLGVTPVAIVLLRRLLYASEQIAAYTDEILASGGGIAGNTAHVADLQQTIAAAPTLLDAAHSLGQNAAAIEAALARRGNGAGANGS
jgi:DNA-binding phage protein